MRIPTATRFAILASLLLGCGGDEREIRILYDHTTGRAVVESNEDLGDVFIRARRGRFGTLDCAEVTARLQSLADYSRLTHCCSAPASI